MSDESSEPLEQTLHRVVVRLALSLEVNEYSYISLEMREKETIDFICSALSSLDPQFDLVNFFGYDYIEEISVIIQNSEYFMKYFKNRRECSDELDYVEYTIPPANLIPINEDELVSTNILGNNSKYFQYNKFNQVQSKVFESVWRTNENILLAAPTGSGKTDVALLAIIKMLTEIKSGAEFRKVIYIAPMKALAAEITKKYNKILAEYKFRVVEYTGDTKREVENVNGADVIICTPEKLDAASRRLSMAITGIRLVIIDEIHLLGERRGAILESLILRLRAISESNQTSIRIIGLSATLPNYKDVGQFIRAAKTFHFDGRYRPVPLTTKIVGFKKRTSQKRRNEYLIKVLAELKKKGKQALIFVSSRAKTTQVAKLISDELQNETAHGIYSYKPINSTKTIKEADLHKMISQLSVSSGQLNTATGSHMNANASHTNTVNASHPSAHISNRLQHFISRRIGIHHAGMPRHERSTVELLFLNSHLDFLVCTSTLAWGVNLPAHAVIIFGTSFYDSSLGSFSQLGILDVVQIFGRAGRPQFDTLGLSYLITDSSHTDMYMSRLKETQPIESHLLFHIVDALSSEIYLKNITDLPSALAWLKDTFLYIRMQHNPSAYGNNQFNNPSLINLIKIAMQRLQASCMLNVMHSNVTHTDILNSNIYSSTFYGRIAAIYCTSYLTIHTWLTLLQSSSVIDLLLACDELTVINIRPDEESDINKIAQQLVLRRILDIEYDNSLQSKLIILFYALINYIDMPSYTLRCDTQYMIDAFDRIIPCLYQLLVYNKKYNEIKELLIYNNKINYTASRQTNRTSNQTSITAIKAIRIGMFVDLKIDIKNSTRNTIYILIYKDGIITHTSKINNGYREIIKANESEIEIEIYGIGRVMKNKVKIEEDYSLYGLYRYGMHSCDGIFRLSGHKEECMHMRSEDESIINTNSNTHSINYNNSIINITQLINNIESFNNLILINYKLNIKMIEIGYLDIKEELSEVDYRIAEMDEEYIYVCESEKIAKNVASKLTRIRGIRGKYEQVEHAKQINENTTKLLTIGYEKIINEKNTGRRRIIMRGCRKRGEYYAVGEILKICDGRESIIYERKEFVEYMEKIIEK